MTTAPAEPSLGDLIAEFHERKALAEAADVEMRRRSVRLAAALHVLSTAKTASALTVAFASLSPGQREAVLAAAADSLSRVRLSATAAAICSHPLAQG
ncbi:hypothetical protein [Saccharicrinis sp. FJH54]|uniref:hypothetical protein n=1 Tax=Saccharicrinis sp. FJH54 TaxID=3344665 RepID=UPI0035D41260